MRGSERKDKINDFSVLGLSTWAGGTIFLLIKEMRTD